MREEIEKINQLYIKGRIDKEKYNRLMDKYAEKLEPIENIKEIISNMSLEELLDTYKNTKEDAASKVMQLLIIAEIERRIEE